jgi:hypothetical protein
MNEIQAEKDLLRAEFAMATCRLEMMIEKLRTKDASQLVEMGKKSDNINRLKLELNTVKVAAAKVVAAYSSRGPIGPTVRQVVPETPWRHDGEVMTRLSPRRSNARTSRASAPLRRAG